jgi:tetratricopeptide (TPR) repeat protein
MKSKRIITESARVFSYLAVVLFVAGGVWLLFGGTSERESARNVSIPPFSESWLDDGGYFLAGSFVEPIADPRSLKQLRRSLADRGKRGIEYNLEQLSKLDPADSDSAVKAAWIYLAIGTLYNYEGEFGRAIESFEKGRSIDPLAKPAMLATFDGLIGISSLRRGEVENCVECRNALSCLFPIDRAAIHQKPAGSREAVARFEAYLKRRPEDLGVQWLLNIAYMTLGEYPDRVPREYLIPIEPFRSKIDFGRFVEIARETGLGARGPNMAGGSAIDDFNNDGLLDIFTSSSSPNQSAAIFINRGDGTFEDRTESAGLGDQIAALNIVQTDYDNDGNLDVLMLRGGWMNPQRPSLLRGRGDGTFEDVTIRAGLDKPIASQAAAWGDYDNDGYVDLYVAGEFVSRKPDRRNRGRLYHNNRDGTFTDRAESAGVLNERGGKGAAWGDYDGDGLIDLYVSNMGGENRLYHNEGNGAFIDKAPALGVVEPIESFSCWFWDYDDDGLLDLFVTGYAQSLSDIVRSHLGKPTGGERPRLYRNDGRGGFQDVTKAAGLDRVWAPMGSNFADFDGDGYLDIYLATGRPRLAFLTPNVMLKNVNGQRFEDVTTSSGTGHLQKGHGVSAGDWDLDGDVDLFVATGGAIPGDQANNLLFDNPGHGGRWIRVELVGVKSNRAGIGAQIEIETITRSGSTRRIHRWISNGSSFGGDTLRPTIGLSDAERIARIRVYWPGNRTAQELFDVPLDRCLRIVEGEKNVRVLDLKPIDKRKHMESTP